jgi:uncharacterized protein YndB with AHSA1/START domain
MPAEQQRTDAVVEHEVRIRASPDSVFEFFTDPRKMVQWMGIEATLDPRPGGVCRVSPSGQATMSGEFVELDPPRRVVFTWGWETELLKTPPSSTLVEVLLTQHGEDTVVRLSHRRLQPETVALHRAGWRHYLARLALVAAGADPGHDAWREIPLDERALSAARVLPG